MELGKPKVIPGDMVRVVKRRGGVKRTYLAGVLDATLSITFQGNVWLYRVATQITDDNPATEIFVVPEEDIIEVY